MKKKRYIHKAKRIMEPKLKMYSIKHFGTLKEGWVNFWFWNVYVKKAFWRYFLPIKSKKKQKKQLNQVKKYLIQQQKNLNTSWQIP